MSPLGGQRNLFGMQNVDCSKCKQTDYYKQAAEFDKETAEFYKQTAEIDT